MAFPLIAERKHTRADLKALVDLAENKDKRFELINGEIYEMPAASLLHNWIIVQIVFLLKTFVDPRRIGVVFGDGAGFDLPNGDSVEPDAAFVSDLVAENLPQRYHLAPDLAVEVVSPSNSPREVADKVESYLLSGSYRVWVVYSEKRAVDIYRLLEDGSIAYKTHRIGDTLSGEGALVSLTIPVADIFPKPQPASSSQESAAISQ